MKNKIKNVRLSFCCKEDWNSFESIDERSRFCQSCRHHVVDFTNGTQPDFDRAMSSGKKICGRFKRSQMNEAFIKLAAVSFLTAASASLVNCSAEKSVEPLVPTPIVRLDLNETVLMGDVVMGIPPLPNKNDSTHLGVVPKIIPDPPRQKAGN